MGDLIGNVVGAVSNLIGTEQTNQKNWDISQANNEWSAQQYASRYQTTVQDLTKAGLNPMLAYSQGPGTAPTASQVAPMQNALGNAVEGFNRTRGTSAQTALQQEQAKQAESQVHLNSAQAVKATSEAEVAKKQAELLEIDRQKREKEIPKVVQETKTSSQLMETLMAQGTASAAQAKHYGSLIENLASQNKNLQAELTRLNQSNDQNAPESKIAKEYPTFYYIFHKLMPTLSGSIPNMPRITNIYK